MSAEVEQAWRADVRMAARRLRTNLVAIDPHEARPLLERFADGLEAPPDARHGAMLAALFIALCVRIVDELHRWEEDSCGCRTVAWSRLGPLVPWRTPDPRPAFRAWITTVTANFSREHPPSVASRAASCIRADPARRWSVKALASVAGTGCSRLRLDFQRRFSLRPTEYVQLVRAIDALPRLGRRTKIEAIAWEVGYRSKKDLYAALKRWSGSTPTELRRCSDLERAWLERQLRARAEGVRHTARVDDGAVMAETGRRAGQRR